MTVQTEDQPVAPRTFEEAQDVLAANLPGYTRRTHQMALAARMEQTLADGQPGLFQAGTGTGKSLAILISLILTGRRSIVATSTKALQTQYQVTDLPFLSEYLGVDFAWAVLKGRSNYPCYAKAETLEFPTPGQRAVVARMQELATDQAVLDREVADREDFPELSKDEWDSFAMSSSECPGKKACPFGSICLAERAKAKAAEADVVVTNTALFLQDRLLRQKTGDAVALLGDFDYVAIDEAHNLPDAATGALEDTLGQGTFRKLARDMGAYLHDKDADEGMATEIEVAAERLWFAVETRYDLFVLDAPPKEKSGPMPLTVQALIDPEQLGDHIVALDSAIFRAREELKSTRAWDDREKIIRERLLRRSADYLGRLQDYATDSPENTVRWAEREERTYRGERRTYTYLRSAPVSVAPFLREALWDKVPAILSSATLAAGKDFSYLAEILGLRQGEAVTYDAGSPFDYQKQVLLFTPDKDMPDPSARRTEWLVYAQQATYHLVEKARGGALLLYTSRSALNEAHRTLAPQFERLGLTVLKQDDAPTSALIRRFKEDGNAVLFGLRTFFEGVDVQGRALRLVVLDKLPFAVPTDLVHQARCDAMVRRHGKWSDWDRITVPQMIIILTQGFGRLIRHRDDIGTVAILDARLNSKSYGKRILAALPPARRTTDPEAAGAFLEGLA